MSNAQCPFRFTDHNDELILVGAYRSEKWRAASPIHLSNTTGKFYGYLPYGETATDLTAISVVSSLNGTDYLYADSKDASYSNKTVDLTMSHALARLHLTIKKGDTYLSGYNLTEIAIESKAIAATDTMDIATGGIQLTRNYYQFAGKSPATSVSIRSSSAIATTSIVFASSQNQNKGGFKKLTEEIINSQLWVIWFVSALLALFRHSGVSLRLP